MKRIGCDVAVRLHTDLIRATGGVTGIRDEGLLDLAINNPFQTFGGQDLYPSLVEKAARLCYSLVMDHPMIDGNKRLGAHLMLVFLELNGVPLYYTQDELVDIIMGVATGTKQYNDIVQWIEEHKKEQ